MKTITSALLGLALTQAAFASGQANLKSDRGDHIQVNFDTEILRPNNGGGTTYFAKNLEVSVSSDLMVGPAQVVIVNNCSTAGLPAHEYEVVVLDLNQHEDGLFVSEPTEITARGGSYRYTTFCTQTLSIVDNGSWLVDPVNGTTNFGSDLFSSADWNTSL